MPTTALPAPEAPLFGDEAGDRLGALGILNSLGLARLGVEFDQLSISPDALASVLPSGEHPILKWRLPQSVRKDPSRLSDFPVGKLEAAADVLGERPGRFRIELHSIPDWQKPEWFLRTIGAADRIKAGSSYLFHERQPQAVTWQWPLRVGFFDDPASTHFFEKLSDHQKGRGDWREKIVRYAAPQKIPGDCGIVVVPSLKEAESAFAAAGEKLKCGALLCLNWDDEAETTPWVQRGRDLLDQFWVGGIAFVQVRKKTSGDFFFEFMRALSHNHAFDRALVEACNNKDYPHPIPYPTLPYPIVAGSTRFMRDSRMTRLLGRMRGSLNSPRMAERTIEIESGSEAEMMIRGGAARARDASSRMRIFEVEEPTFQHEGNFSTGMAEFGMAVEASMESEMVDSQQHGPRFLQCKVSEAGGTALSEAFRPGKTHQAKVRIGLPSSDWLQSSLNISFPVEELPPDQKEYELTVAFAPLTGSEGSEQRFRIVEKKSITLPRVGGNSSSADFNFKVPAGARVYEARVLVLFENRILQTGRLSGAVGEPLADEPFDRIHFEIEALVSRYFSDLEYGTRFEQSLLFNQNADESTGMTVAAGGELAISAPQGLVKEVEWFQKKFSTMAFEPKDFMGDIGSRPEVMKFLVALARHGSNLREIIERHIPPESTFDSRSPIQILTKAMGDALPIEFAYDFKPPAPDAKLCPGTKDPEFLEGKCSHPHDASVVCPAGFWGLNRVIERHKFIPGGSAESFTLRNEPTAAGAALSPFTRSLLAGSQEVDAPFKPESGMAIVLDALQSTVEGKSSLVETWQAWEANVASEAPSLLVLVVHTEYDGDFDEQKMEVGQDQWLYFNSIGTEHVGGGSEPGPIVFLIGCKTGTGKISYQSLSSEIKANGASIVVSSMATINSQHAVPVLEKLIRLLREAIDSPDHQTKNFGEVMRRMRCHMLSEGMLMAMCLEACGDADWILT